VRIGRLRRRLTLLRRDPTIKSVTGALTGEWLPVPTIGDNGVLWGGLEMLTGREFWAGYAEAKEAQFNVITRYWPDIRPTDRFRADGKDIQILMVLDPNGMHDELQMPARWILQFGDGASG
jgi:SPP1 family predicted phage head-tail adaptor